MWNISIIMCFSIQLITKKTRRKHWQINGGLSSCVWRILRLAHIVSCSPLLYTTMARKVVLLLACLVAVLRVSTVSADKLTGNCVWGVDKCISDCAPYCKERARLQEWPSWQWLERKIVCVVILNLVVKSLIPLTLNVNCCWETYPCCL